MIGYGGKSTLKASNSGQCVHILSGQTDFPFSTSADLLMTLKWAVYNPWNMLFMADVGFGVDGRRRSVRRFEILPYSARTVTLGITMRRLLAYLDLPVPPPGGHIIIDWFAGVDGVITSAMRRKIDIEEGLPDEAQFPLWMIPAIGGGIIALGVGIKLFDMGK